MQCVVCGNNIPDLSPSDDFCGSYCQLTWQQGNAEWPSWAYSWNGKNRKGEAANPNPYSAWFVTQYPPDVT